MSIRAMNWAWSQKLRPVPKLILLALADAADHSGICWPSVPTIARLTEVSVRTVQRELERFRAEGLMDSEPRFRNDGSRTSNRYRLRIDAGGDKLSPPAEASTTTPCRPTSPDGGVSVEVTTSDSSCVQQPPQIKAQPVSVPAPADGAGSCGLRFPELLPTELDGCRRLVSQVGAEVGQQLLDELSGRLQIGGVRTSPVSYLRSLIARHARGEFQPELALGVAEQRKQRKQTEARLQAAREGNDLQQRSELKPVPTDPELARNRLRALKDLIKGRLPQGRETKEK